MFELQARTECQEISSDLLHAWCSNGSGLLVCIRHTDLLLRHYPGNGVYNEAGGRSPALAPLRFGTSACLPCDLFAKLRCRSSSAAMMSCDRCHTRDQGQRNDVCGSDQRTDGRPGHERAPRHAGGAEDLGCLDVEAKSVLSYHVRQRDIQTASTASTFDGLCPSTVPPLRMWHYYLLF